MVVPRAHRSMLTVRPGRVEWSWLMRGQAPPEDDDVDLVAEAAMCRAGGASPVSAVDEARERVRASLKLAKPGPPLSGEERANLAEVEPDRGKWLTTEEMFARLGEHPARDSDEDDGE